MTMPNTPSILYPLSPGEHLKSLYLSKPLTALPTPAAILDVAAIRRNCDRMLDTCEALGLGFRAHVKTHKTVELTRYQLLGSKPMGSTGTAIGTGRVCVSTLAEAEGLIPLVKEGIVKDILYAFPLPQSAVPRLHQLLRIPFPDLKISVLVDNYDQLSFFCDYLEKQAGNETAAKYGVYIKIDAGYHRAGIHLTDQANLDNLITLSRNVSEAGTFNFIGIYTHAGDSYNSSEPDDAAWSLIREIEAGLHALEYDVDGKATQEPIILSVGASPTALVLSNFFNPVSDSSEASSIAFARLRQLLGQVKLDRRIHLEVHAGVYATLDLQQVSTGVLAAPLTHSLNDIAITILAEVSSVYERRNEVLVNVGTTGIGREPGRLGCEWEKCWAVVTNWDDKDRSSGRKLDDGGWIVRKLSQEHGILGWKKENDPTRCPLSYGRKVRIFPQHSCIAGSGHGWYFIVDSDTGVDGGNVVVDVWVRFRGW